MYNDIDLHNKCHISEQIAAEQKAIFRRFTDGHKFFISSKCSYVIPELVSYIDQTTADKENASSYKVPNIVHYVSFNRYEWKFLNYISMRSAHQYIRPHAIFLHGDTLPFGYWWNRTVQDIPNVYHVFREKPRRIQGRLIQWLEHSSDITRIMTVFGTCIIYLIYSQLRIKISNRLPYFHHTLAAMSNELDFSQLKLHMII